MWKENCIRWKENGMVLNFCQYILFMPNKIKIGNTQNLQLEAQVHFNEAQVH